MQREKPCILHTLLLSDDLLWTTGLKVLLFPMTNCNSIQLMKHHHKYPFWNFKVLLFRRGWWGQKKSQQIDMMRVCIILHLVSGLLYRKGRRLKRDKSEKWTTSLLIRGSFFFSGVFSSSQGDCSNLFQMSFCFCVGAEDKLELQTRLVALLTK